ncbi:methionine--tRNA ligase [Fulvitalea axinellae]|uniref:Methionine--tRNA ligase n=1 Tax=Fulvitalea axinellae TaxID=1182444 RepID=A0AAU9CNJ2_9BACT|nr:methionine--tRNA ligase [Fulvitalea axinellae]
MANKEAKRYTVTAALPYTNGPVHIGHLAGVYVPADIYARYRRLKKDDVVFVCGSDEHGVPITIRAKKEGITPQEVVDKYHFIIKEAFEKFGISFDIYSRTSSKTHANTASDFFKDLYNKNEFVEQVSEQYYDEANKQFLADRYITGTCPKCGNENAYGDQCESCGSSLSPTELINPKSALSGEKPVLKDTKHWFLPLDKYEPWLKEWILEDHKEWKSNVYGQCKSWLDSGLHPRAVTRDLDWGVPVPVEGADGKVLYVWFDAPIGYISATKDWATEAGKDWEPYWKSDDTKLVHFIGKDNIVFHCIIFPTMLKAHGDYILPDNVPANEFLNLEGDKISTSKNWAVWLHEFLEDMPGKQDVLRYMLCANAPEAKDNDFTWKDFQTRNNSELVAIFGNFVRRAEVLTHKFFDGKIPPIAGLEDYDREIISKLEALPAKIAEGIESYKFREALASMMEVARLGNKYLADTEPWKLIKTDPERTGTILNISLQLAANLSILARPFMPFTADKLKDLFNLGELAWTDAGRPDLLEVGQQINKGGFLFEQIDDEMIEKQRQKLEDTKKANELEKKVAPVTQQKELTSFDDFMKMDLRVGEIVEAEKVKKSKKLLKLKVDTGMDQRTVVSGIAQSYSPEEVIGKKILLLANLAPRKIMGIESQGMILMAENSDGTLAFLNPDKNIYNGGTVS